MINFENRLKSLKKRRQGASAGMYLDDISFDLESKENYENLSELSSIKYTIGAMAPVEEKYTKVSIKEGKRVADSLIKSLKQYRINASSKLQGSVALDIHIKGHSDVDMLIIEKDTIQAQTPTINSYDTSKDTRGMVEIIKDLRIKSEMILPKNFPKANIKLSGNKSIVLDGGSLERKVDIVPASWVYTHAYQSSNKKSDRGINIYHKGNHELILNLPFTHMKLIRNKDTYYSGNLRNCIRLMKSMVADMPHDKKRIAKKLSSYDLTSIAYHMNEELELPYERRIELVERIKEHLNYLSTDSNYRSTLEVPDKSRIIFDNKNKIKALEIIKKDFNDLARLIFNDLN